MKYFAATFTVKNPVEHDLKEIKAIGFTSVISGYANLSSNVIAEIKKLGMNAWIEVGCFQGEDLWQKYPDSRPIIDGKPLNKLGPGDNKWYAGVIPTKKVVEDRLRLINSLLDTLEGLDVLYLDFCRYPGRWEDGEGNVIYADNTPDIRIRDAVITDFIAKVQKICKKHGIKLGIFLTPYDNMTYGQNVQNIKQLCDYYSPMLYHKICKKPASWIGEKIEEYKGIFGNILPVIQTIPEPSQVRIKDFQSELREIKEHNIKAFMILSYEAMSNRHKKELNGLLSEI